MPILTELLNTRIHNRAHFHNQDEEITLFFKTRANKEHKLHLSDTYVLVNSGAPTVILGYFTLSLGAVSLTDLPEQLSKKLPKYDNFGTVLLGRMGRDSNLSQKGFGAVILRSAMIESLSRKSFFALELHAKNNVLVKYYKNFGFIELLDDKQHLILPKKTIADALKSN